MALALYASAYSIYLYHLFGIQRKPVRIDQVKSGGEEGLHIATVFKTKRYICTRLLRVNVGNPAAKKLTLANADNAKTIIS